MTCFLEIRHFVTKTKKKLQDEICTKKIQMQSYWHKDTHSLIRGLTAKIPSERFRLAEIKSHPFFKSIHWQNLLDKKIAPPYVPPTPKGELDVSNFDESYTSKPVKSQWSVGPSLSTSQEEMFKDFSFSRSFTPPPNNPLSISRDSNSVLDVSGIQSELSAELLSLSMGNTAAQTLEDHAFNQ